MAQGPILRQKEELIFIGCLQRAKHSAKHDTGSISIVPHDNTAKWVLFSCPVCREESQSVRKLCVSKSQVAKW